jgi:hypothetical protein
MEKQIVTQLGVLHTVPVMHEHRHISGSIRIILFVKKTSHFYIGQPHVLSAHNDCETKFLLSPHP